MLMPKIDGRVAMKFLKQEKGKGGLKAYHSGWLVVDTALESGGAPVDELDGTLGLDGGHSCVDILGHNISTVHEAAGHVLAVAGVALGHHGCGLEGRVGDLSHAELLVVGLLGRDDWGVGGKHEVDTGVGHQVGLELCDIHVQGSVEPQRGCQGGDDLQVRIPGVIICIYWTQMA